MRTLKFWFGLMILLLACRPPAEPAHLRIAVSDDTQQPLSEVGVRVAERVIATTGPDGATSIALPAPNVGSVFVRVECPDAYRPLPARLVKVAQGENLSLHFECRPRLRTVAVVVHAPVGEGALLRADGEPVGRVAADGTMHVVLKRPPDAVLRLMLDTHDTPDLRPQNPLETFVVPDRDRIFLFNRRFVKREPEAVPERRPRKPRAPKVEARHIPYAIRRYPK